MANKKITDVDIVNTINDADYLFVNQNSVIRQFKKSNIIKDISDNYDENMINKKDKKSILSIVAFTDNADIEYQDLINGLKANILTE